VSKSLQQLYQSSHLYGSNAPYIEAYYEGWLSDPDAVPEQWARAFRDMHNGSGDTISESGRLAVEARFEALGRLPPSVATDTSIADHKEAGVLKLINAFRVRGHENAMLDPLGRPHHAPVPDLTLEFQDLSEFDLDLEFDTGSLAAPDRMKLREIVALCRKVYCGNIGIEYMHIVDTTKRRWLQARLEGSGGEYAPSKEVKVKLLRQLTAAEGIERYLHSRFVGQKRFSLEGGESLIPLLNGAIRHAGNQGIREVVIGMAHRGRLNVLVNTLGKSPSVLFEEFEGKKSQRQEGRSGDVKYHLGYSSDLKLDDGEVHVALAFNPSHLEIVDAVVAGSARARQDRRRDLGDEAVMPILIHGDAAFAGQGVVMELFQMSEVPGFEVGGTLHIVINNQIGFTTNPRDGRSTLYCTTVAKMVHAPIFHVNADEPEAVLHVMKIACDFRRQFKRDVVIDLVSYRRHGHNEVDEPAATQPMMYQIIRKMKTTRQLYADRLVASGVVSDDEVSAMMDAYRDRLDDGKQVAADILDKPKSTAKFIQDWSRYQDHEWDEKVDTTIDAKTLEKLSGDITSVPDGFELHARVEKIIEDRRKMARGDAPMDWGFAETMAYASLINEGFGLRLVGQDTGRGTFFHRHAIFYNQKDGETYIPLQYIDPEVNVAIVDSLLSEEAVLGFEYGYACSEPNSLVIWEAQFGDFVNAAQVVIDQFITSGEAKWGRLCGLALFLPHGYEGQGPEHSSARLERFMQLCSHNNIQVCIPTTPAQMFHMLRRQMKRDYRKPLVVMTPKSLLRSKASTSPLEALTEGGFRLVIDDESIDERSEIERVVLCSGKVYYDLAYLREEESFGKVALVRLEQLYPFPGDQVREVLSRYPESVEVAWCQEEPQNQGAWYSAKHNIEASLERGHSLYYAGRPSAASPAVGSYDVHIEEQKKLVAEALTVGGGDKQ
jgi:2-oxoglutarate dehydrogenase E1 component